MIAKEVVIFREEGNRPLPVKARVMEEVDEAVMAKKAIHHVHLDPEVQEVAKIVHFTDHTINPLREVHELSLRQIEPQAIMLIILSTNRKVHLLTQTNGHIVKELKDRVRVTLHQNLITGLKEVLRTDRSVLVPKEEAVMRLVAALIVLTDFHQIQIVNHFHHVVKDLQEKQDQRNVQKDRLETDHFVLLVPIVLEVILHAEVLRDQNDLQETQIVNHFPHVATDL
jgi:hypothetical protein